MALTINGERMIMFGDYLFFYDITKIDNLDRTIDRHNYDSSFLFFIVPDPIQRKSRKRRLTEKEKIRLQKIGFEPSTQIEYISEAGFSGAPVIQQRSSHIVGYNIGSVMGVCFKKEKAVMINYCKVLLFKEEKLG